MSTAMQQTRQYSTFRIGELLLGIEVTKVQEVIRHQEMTQVPLAPSVIEGLINLRGQIVIAIDTRRSLGMLPSTATVLPMNVVIQTDDEVVSLLVDEIGDVINAPLSACAPVPDNMPQEQRNMIECVYDLAEGLMLVLDTNHLLMHACN